MLILAMLALAQAAPQQGPMKTFGDWVVACDNVKRCEMTSLQPEGGEALDHRLLQPSRRLQPRSRRGGR